MSRGAYPSVLAEKGACRSGSSKQLVRRCAQPRANGLRYALWLPSCPIRRWCPRSCPTRERPEFALQAVRYLCDQDYPNKEMVVIEDGTPSLAGRLPDRPTHPLGRYRGAVAQHRGCA
jgi:hypothetical protein